MNKTKDNLIWLNSSPPPFVHAHSRPEIVRAFHNSVHTNCYLASFCALLIGQSVCQSVIHSIIKSSLPLSINCFILRGVGVIVCQILIIFIYYVLFLPWESAENHAAPFFCYIISLFQFK